MAAVKAAMLHGLQVNNSSIIFTVTSTGCTQEKDFELLIEPGPTVTLIRTRLDHCRRAPMTMRIKKPLHNLSLETPFAIRNPFYPASPKNQGNFRKPRAKQPLTHDTKAP